MHVYFLLLLLIQVRDLVTVRSEYGQAQQRVEAINEELASLRQTERQYNDELSALQSTRDALYQRSKEHERLRQDVDAIVAELDANQDQIECLNLQLYEDESCAKEMKAVSTQATIIAYSFVFLMISNVYHMKELEARIRDRDRCRSELNGVLAQFESVIHNVKSQQAKLKSSIAEKHRLGNEVEQQRQLQAQAVAFEQRAKDARVTVR